MGLLNLNSLNLRKQIPQKFFLHEEDRKVFAFSLNIHCAMQSKPLLYQISTHKSVQNANKNIQKNRTNRSSVIFLSCRLCGFVLFNFRLRLSFFRVVPHYSVTMTTSASPPTMGRILPSIFLPFTVIDLTRVPPFSNFIR